MASHRTQSDARRWTSLAIGHNARQIADRWRASTAISRSTALRISPDERGDRCSYFRHVATRQRLWTFYRRNARRRQPNAVSYTLAKHPFARPWHVSPGSEPSIPTGYHAEVESRCACQRCPDFLSPHHSGEHDVFQILRARRRS